MPTKASSSTKRTIDFTGVEDRAGGPPAAHVTPGDYVLRVESATIKPTKDHPDREYVNWQCTIVESATDSPARGTIYHTTSLMQNALWNLRGWLKALLGKEIPQRSVGVDFSAYDGKLIGVTLDDDDPYYNADTQKTTQKSRVVATFPASEFSRPGGAAPAAAANGKVSAATAHDVVAAELTAAGADDEDLAELSVEDL